MKTTHFIRIGQVCFDLNKIHRYWPMEKTKQIAFSDGHSEWTISFDSISSRDEALAQIDHAAMEGPPKP